MSIVIDGGRKISRKSWSGRIGMLELVLAISLFYYPDYSKVFLFMLPLVLIAVVAAEEIYKYFRKNGTIINLLCGILPVIIGIYIGFLGRKTFMIGTAIMLLIDAVRFFSYSRSSDIKILEKMIFFCGAILAAVWTGLVLFKGLHLYWSVREYLAMYFAGAAILSFFRKR